MISPTLVRLVRCPECRHALQPVPKASPLGEREADLPVFECTGCRARYPAPASEFLDLRPARPFAEQTRYLDATLHQDGRHESVSPPLLSAAIRNDMLRAFLAPRPGDRILDLGCGSGRTLIWNRKLGGYTAGIDVSPFFAAEARAEADLALGDLRRLPFQDGSFNKAYALDVFEHLSAEALGTVLDEVARVLGPAGELFVYTHVRRNSPLALGLKAINRLAQILERHGLIDLRDERLRKSDHVNPLGDLPELQRVVSAAGFRIARIRYYTPLVGGLVENIFVRLASQVLQRRVNRLGRSAAGGARREAKRRIARRGPLYLVLKMLTAAMKLDVLLFGRIESGPFFALLVKTEQAASSGPSRAIA